MDITAHQEVIARLDALAADRPAWRRSNRYYHRAIERIYRFLVPEGQRVLEIGCGNGDLLAALKPARGLGVDLSGSAIAQAKEAHGGEPSLEFLQDDAAAFSRDEQFDYVILADTVSFLPDIQKTFENLHHVMTPRSRLIVNAYSFLWEPAIRCAEALGLKQRQGQMNWLAVTDIENLLHLAGFEVVHREGFLLLPKYVPLLSTVLNGFLAKLPLFRVFTLAQFVVARPVHAPPRDVAENHTVSVVIPARNEAGNIEAAVTRTPDMGTWTELIFVEGHSKDATWDEIKRVRENYPQRRIKIMQQDGRGKKDAVYKGFAHAEGEILMILDADLTMPPEDLPKFYRAVAYNKGEYINGCRLVYPMENKAMRFLNLLANKFFSWAFSYILSQPYKDTLCGTKVLWRKDYDRLASGRAYFGEFDPFGDFDLIFGAAKLNLTTAEIPIRYRERTYGETQISRFSHGWLLLRMAWIGFRKFKWNVR